jgi:hypothetical protein
VGGNRVDRKGPTIAIAQPTAAVYLLNQVVAANYACADGGSGVAACAGSSAAGAPIATNVAGPRIFSVAASDGVGNASSASVNYSVRYALELLFDQTKAVKAGSTIPIKVRLLDAAAANHSAATLSVNAIAVVRVSSEAVGEVQDAGNANPDSNFRYSEAGYIFNLKTTGLATGTYELQFVVGSDPAPYGVSFQVR